MPLCVDLRKVVGQVSQTRSNSVYLVRDANEYTLNGKIYVITPNVEFNEPATVSMGYSGLIGNLETYKYDSHEGVLESCYNKIVLNSVVSMINSNGGAISLDRINLDIPPNALSEEVNFEITEYELSNCITPGKENSLSNILKDLSNLDENSFLKNYGVVSAQGKLLAKMQKNENGIWVDKEVVVDGQIKEIIIDENFELPEDNYIYLYSGELFDGNNNLIGDLFEGWNEKDIRVNSVGSYRVYASFEYNGKKIEGEREFKVEEPVVAESSQTESFLNQVVNFVKDVFNAG